MKKSSLITRLITAVFFTSLVLVACKKENSASLTPEQEAEAATMSSESEAESEVVFNDVFDNVMGVNTEVGVGGTGVFGRMSSGNAFGRETRMDSLNSCVQVTITLLNPPARFPMKITIDFGNGCLGRDGHWRYGKIVTVYTGHLMQPGNSATTTFENFKLDSIKVEGTHKIANTTNNTAGNNLRQLTITVTDAKLTKPNGNYIMWNNHRVITQIEGNGTAMPLDDVFKITGSGRGKVKRGDVLYAWQSEITDPLIKKFICRWISKGIIKVRRETLASNSHWVAILNYGSGPCDYFATLTINGVTNNIQLPH